MTDSQNLPTPNSKLPRKKMWVFFAVFILFAATMYGSTMYRIRTAGYLGQNQDKLAHPEQGQPTAEGAQTPKSTSPVSK